jgi:hypothetical protein
MGGLSFTGTTAAQFRTVTSAAASGSNTDITYLLGLVSGSNSNPSLAISGCDIGIYAKDSNRLAFGSISAGNAEGVMYLRSNYLSLNKPIYGYSPSTASAPTFSENDNAGTGIYFPSGGVNVGVSCNGTQRGLFTTSGLTLSASNTVLFTSGTHGKTGTFVLSSGTVTVSNTNVTTNSVVCCTVKTSSGTLGTGTPEIVCTSGTGFTATGIATDNSTYNYVIFESNQ